MSFLSGEWDLSMMTSFFKDFDSVCYFLEIAFDPCQRSMHLLPEVSLPLLGLCLAFYQCLEHGLHASEGFS